MPACGAVQRSAASVAPHVVAVTAPPSVSLRSIGSCEPRSLAAAHTGGHAPQSSAQLEHVSPAQQMPSPQLDGDAGCDDGGGGGDHPGAGGAPGCCRHPASASVTSKIRMPRAKV